MVKVYVQQVLTPQYPIIFLMYAISVGNKCYVTLLYLSCDTTIWALTWNTEIKKPLLQHGEYGLYYLLKNVQL